MYFVGECVSTFIKTTQTLTLLMNNHEDAGGKEPPSTYARYMGFFGFVDLDFLSWMPGLGCAFEGFEYDLYMHTGSLVLVLLAGVVVWKRKSRLGDPNAWRILKTMIWACKLVLPAVSQTIFKTFRCQGYDNEQYNYLLVDQSIDCDSESYTGLAMYASVMVLLFPLGMPLAALVGLTRLRPLFEGLEGEGAAGGVNLRRTEHPVLSTSPWLSLFKAYRPIFAWWYEVVDMLRRLALTCGTLLFLEVNQFMLFSIAVAFLALTVHEQLKPFGSSELNSLVSVEHSQNLLCLVMLLIQDADMFEGSAYGVVGGVLLVTNAFMLVVILYSVLPSPAQIRQVSAAINKRVTRRGSVSDRVSLSELYGGVETDFAPPAISAEDPTPEFEFYPGNNPLFTGGAFAGAGFQKTPELEMVEVDLGAKTWERDVPPEMQRDG